MLSGFQLIRSWFFAAATAALATAGCGLLEPKATPDFAPVGSSWTINYRATGSFGQANDQRTSVVRPNQTWEGRSVRALEGKDFTTLSDLATGGWIAQVRGTTPLLSWNPPLAWDWPLTVGKTFTRKQNVLVHATKQTIAFESTWVVEAYEDVTVPAGTFKAFRVKYTDNIGNEAINWWSPQVQGNAKTSSTRTAKHRAGPGTIDAELVSFRPAP
jgi:hypothetical protein